MKRRSSLVLVLAVACSSSADDVPATSAGAPSGAPALAPTPSAVTPEAPTPGCAARPAPPDAPAAPSPDLYPAARYVSAATLGAPAKTACVETAALPAHARVDALVASMAKEAGLALGRPGDCACDWSLVFAAAPPALAGEAATPWKAAGASPDRYVVATRLDGGRTVSTLYAASEAAAMYALRAAFALSRAEDGGARRAALATIVDWPDVARRGVVEGIYGPSTPGAGPDCGRSTGYYLPYRVEDRSRLLRLMARARLNTFMYGPKCDPFAGPAAWDQAYPEGYAQAVAAAAHEADANLVDFVYGIRPLSFYARPGTYQARLAKLTAKLDAIRALGVRHFALFWDDSYDFPGSVADQIRLINDVDTYVKKSDPKDRLTVVGQPYCGKTDDFCSGPNALTDAWGAGLHADIAIFWTGTGVEPPTMNAGQMTAINASYRRKVTIWDNWPCSGGDRCGGPGFRGRSGDLPGAIAGYFANPVLNEHPGPALPVARFFEVLGPIADWAWNAKAYAGREAASYARWQPKLAALGPAIGAACTPCGAYGDYWTCSKTDKNAIAFCDPDTKCLSTFACAKGCEAKPAPSPDVCHFGSAP